MIQTKSCYFCHPWLVSVRFVLMVTSMLVIHIYNVLLCNTESIFLFYYLFRYLILTTLSNLVLKKNEGNRWMLPARKLLKMPSPQWKLNCRSWLSWQKLRKQVCDVLPSGVTTFIAHYSHTGMLYVLHYWCMIIDLSRFGTLMYDWQFWHMVLFSHRCTIVHVLPLLQI